MTRRTASQRRQDALVELIRCIGDRSASETFEIQLEDYWQDAPQDQRFVDAEGLKVRDNIGRTHTIITTRKEGRYRISVHHKYKEGHQHKSDMSLDLPCDSFQQMQRIHQGLAAYFQEA